MKRILLFSSLLFSLFVSCKKPEDKVCYGIVSPANDPSDVTPIFTPFNWLNCSTMPSHIVLSAKGDFSNPIMDKNTFTTSVKADTILMPLTKYYWIVTVQGQDQSYLDSFTTGGVATIISGNYSGTGRNNNYALIGDTTYSYSLTVSYAGGDNIALKLPGIDSVNFSKIGTTDSTVIYTCKPCSGKYGGFKSLTYFPATSGISIVFQTPSVNFDEWDFTGTKHP